ncbi:hypothetical protein [Antarctobacter jejuensis]|uniref:hypothetical protein n=1 Tax=Antarctobacter jejuensis TaxID=1439938 RepID=UPI003FD6BB4E
MSTSPNTEILLGCDPQVRVVVIEDGGNIVLQVFAQDPANTDIDALFFNLTDDSLAPDLTIWPAYDESIGSNGDGLTGFDVATGALNQLNNGAQIEDSYDVRLEFGTIPYSSGGDVDQASLTLYLDAGDYTLTAADLDLQTMTAVINSDGGNGLALTGGTGAPETQVQITALSETFDGHFGDSVAQSDGWYINSYGRAVTNGHHDGALVFDQVTTDGPVTLSLDARGAGLRNFENSGHAADSLTLQVQIDGGDWVTLDTFAVNDAGTALVGDTTGQTIGGGWGGLSYSGGVLDSADSSVQFRLASDISAGNEVIRIDNVEITATETETAGAPVTTTLAEESFDGLAYATQSDDIRWNEGWEVRNGELKADGCNDGNIWFESVTLDGAASLSFDARAPHTEYFESGGHYGDSLEVWALVDGTDWHLLDTYTVNAEGTALVGDTTGQSITAQSQTLSYEGGPLTDATSVQLVLDADISARNEEIFVDNYVVTDTVITDAPATEETCEDFEDAHAGDTAALQFDGFSVTGQRAGDAADSENDAMIFDTANPTGGDWDLGFADQGKAIILSEDNHSWDPDDNYNGGTLTFEFDAISDVTSLTVLDVEEDGGAIDLYDAEGELINSLDIPAAGNNAAQDIAINASGVASMTVTLTGSGAVDDLCFAPTDSAADCGQYDVTYDQLMADASLAEEEIPEDLPHDVMMDDVYIYI